MLIQWIQEQDKQYFECCECGMQPADIAICADWDGETPIMLCKACFTEWRRAFTNRLQLLITLGEEL